MPIPHSIVKPKLCPDCHKTYKVDLFKRCKYCHKSLKGFSW